MSPPRIAGIERALVLGGTGHIGSAIVRELLAVGAAVTVASRRARRTPNLQGLDVDFVTTPSAAPHRVAEHVPGHDLVVDAAAPYPLRIFDQARSYGMTAVQHAQCRCDTLLAAVRRARSRLAVVGSFTTLPHPGIRDGHLEPRLLARLHPYFAVKASIEAAVLDAARKGLPALVINPTAVIGPWDYKEPSLCFLPLVLTGKLPFTSARVVNVIDVREVATALVRAVSAGYFGTRLPLCGHNVRLCDLTAEACALVQVKPPRLFGSTRYGAALAYWGELAWGLVGVNSPVPTLPIFLTRYSYPMEPAPSQRQLGVVARPLATTLRDAIKWYASAGYLGHLSTVQAAAMRVPPSE